MTVSTITAPPRCDRCGAELVLAPNGRLVPCRCLARGLLREHRPVPVFDGRDRAAGAEVEGRTER